MNAIEAYALGRNAGEAAAKRRQEMDGQPQESLGGLSHSAYWKIYSDVMRDLAGLGMDETGDEEDDR